MDFGLKGRVAIVAAASKGLGRAAAEELAQEGCEIAICARTGADLERTATEIAAANGRAVFWRAVDVTKPEAVAAFVDEVEKRFARIVLLRGAIVPRHHHRSEQYTMIFSGALKFLFDDGSETTVHAGEILMIPANVPHSAEALEDTVDFDFFSPRREDWIRKDDAYLRMGAKKE